MKILIIARLYTGMADSVATEKWKPKGMPAFYKLVEGLERRGVTGEIVLSAKTNILPDKLRDVKTFRFDNLNFNFHILPYTENILMRRTPVERLLNEISHLRYCIGLQKQKNFDLIYCDQSNVNFGAFFAKFMRKKVILRLLGTGSVMKVVNSLKRKLDPSLVYPSFFAPFSFIFCSRDGSGERYFLSNFINKKVPYEILLNGVDPRERFDDAKESVFREYNLKGGYPLILFVGKMEEHKGCREFLDAMIELNSVNPNFYSLMAGEGPLLEELRARAEKEALSNKVIITGGVKHEDIYRYYDASDIYVSLNRLGSISNTTLEAINSGKCVFILSAAKEGTNDKDTHEVIPLDTAVRVDRDDMAHSLSRELKPFLENRDLITAYSDKTKALANRILKSWGERIDHEIDVMLDIASGKRSG